MDVERDVKLTKLQERALVCLYRRAMARGRLRTSTPSHRALCQIGQAAGKGAQPVGEPYDLLRWDRIDRLHHLGLVHAGWDDYHSCRSGVLLTPAGCREAERRLA